MVKQAMVTKATRIAWIDDEAIIMSASAQGRGASRNARTKVGIHSSGLWRQRSVVSTLLRADPVRIRMGAPPVEMIAGWGHKNTSAVARRTAFASGVPYVALEDGFLRSVVPGRGPSLSYVIDDLGIYYDSHSPSRLEEMLQDTSWFGQNDHDRAREAIGLLRSLRLSKYNNFPKANAARGRILIVDQTLDDASIQGAGVNASTFREMLAHALEHAGQDAIAVKIHPETAMGRKLGHLTELARELGIRTIASGTAWDLVESFDRIFVVSSGFGFDALMAGGSVTCFGMPFYAGWGLTEDLVSCSRRTAQLPIEKLVAAVLFHYSRYLDPWENKQVAFEDAAQALAFLCDRFHENGSLLFAAGLSPWKKHFVAPFLEGAAGRPNFTRSVAEAAELASASGGAVLVWGRKDTGPAAARNLPVARVEDGFIRSIGLGASLKPAASLVVDFSGIYYDPSRSSDFERLALQGVSDPQLLTRAKELREAIIRARLSKYNEGAKVALPPSGGRLRVLVPGQVEGDASVLLGAPEIGSNAELLRRVRQRNPDAFILFKPHPDVERGYRAGRTPEQTVLRYADAIVRDARMPDLLDWCDSLETMTSLAGFEALLRGKAVVAHGMPFYAGWGLTEDLRACSRRTCSLSLDEFVAIALILYPRYVDPVSGLPCRPELIVSRFASALAGSPKSYPTIHQVARHAAAQARRVAMLPALSWARSLQHRFSSTS